MSHPCGSYNSHTLKILKNLGVEIGFKQIMNNKKQILRNMRFVDKITQI